MNGEVVEQIKKLSKAKQKHLFQAHLQRYKNKDKRCAYPFTPDLSGYCWSYANYIDDGAEILFKWNVTSMEQICSKCGFWKEKK